MFFCLYKTPFTGPLTFVAQYDVVVDPVNPWIVTGPADCAGVNSVLVDGGVFTIQSDCHIDILDVTGAGRVDVESSGALTVNSFLVLEYSSIMRIAGTLDSSVIRVESGSRMNLLGYSYVIISNFLRITGNSQVDIQTAATLLVYSSTTIEQVSTLSVAGTFSTTALDMADSSLWSIGVGAYIGGLSSLSSYGSTIMNHGVHLMITDLTFEYSSFECLSSCALDAINAVLEEAEFLANAVSSEHQACATPGITTIASGGNHAGCSGEHSCCPTSALRPEGEAVFPRSKGFKGGECFDDGAGLGGGALEVYIQHFTSLNGVNTIHANGGIPDPLVTGIGGGGSGGSIILGIPCNNSIFAKFNIQANGGDAETDTSQPAFGGSGGRISIQCSTDYSDDPPIDTNITAYGGLNAGAVGWGASGTIVVPKRMDVGGSIGYWPRIYISENPFYYLLVPSPYYPATFVALTETDIPTGPSYLFHQLVYVYTNTWSDVFFTYSGAGFLSRDVEDITPGIFVTTLGNLVDATPGLWTLSITSANPRPWLPKTPNQPGTCMTYYMSKYTNIHMLSTANANLTYDFTGFNPIPMTSK